MGKYDSKRIVYVTPFQGSPVRYGFGTNIDAAQSAQLGHTALSGQAPQGYVFGANSPKPARASRQLATGTVSSFINAGNVVAARNQGWSVGRAKLRRGSATTKTIAVYITINGVKYAWLMPRDTRQRIGGQLTSLGIRIATTQDTDLVFGANFPKPPRAIRTIGTGQTADRISTFYDPSNNLPEGWSQSSSGVDPTQTP